MRNMYVDHLLRSLHTIQEIRMLYCESKELFADSRFELMKWSTNATEVYSDIPELIEHQLYTLYKETPNLQRLKELWTFGGIR